MSVHLEVVCGCLGAEGAEPRGSAQASVALAEGGGWAFSRGRDDRVW